MKFLDKAESGWYSVLTKHGFFPVDRSFEEWDFNGETARERRWWLEARGGFAISVSMERKGKAGSY
ncbi:MAG: hypothetical protein ACXW4K_11190, partial [Candidatus Deferrimicrobiaceae bacterium]